MPGFTGSSAVVVVTARVALLSATLMVMLAVSTVAATSPMDPSMALYASMLAAKTGARVSPPSRRRSARSALELTSTTGSIVISTEPAPSARSYSSGSSVSSTRAKVRVSIMVTVSSSVPSVSILVPGVGPAVGMVTVPEIMLAGSGSTRVRPVPVRVKSAVSMRSGTLML